ncbi:MAG TPA: cation transporter [Egibacteraceae bacterium]|nr:cation transporter [Egibacteraceae bacterium]
MGTDARTLTRPEAVGRARALNRLTIGWNVVEAFVALAAGVAAGSISLIGFGLDSTIEVSAALVLAWRLRQEQRTGCTQPSDRRATRLIAVSFLLLAAYVGAQAVRDLAGRADPEASAVGIAVTALSLAVMPVLARAKRRLAPVMGSRAVEAEAAQTNICAILSGVVLAGLAANALLGWWWADPSAALVVAGIAAFEGRRAWRADALADTCCA